MKEALEDRFRGAIRFEVPVDDRRADAIISLPTLTFTVECQASPLDSEEWQARTEDHNVAGYPVLWLWHVRRFRRLTWDEFRVPSEILTAHADNDRLVYVMDEARRLLAVTLGNAPERTVAADSDYWRESYVPKTIKRWYSTLADMKPVSGTTPSGLRLVQIGDHAAVHVGAYGRSFTWRPPQ